MSGTIEYGPLLRGTPDADSIRVSDLLAFDWQPDPGGIRFCRHADGQ
jgi:hypothetical protein